jgi:hypothetical protein
MTQTLKTLAIVAAVSTLAACSSTKSLTNSDEPIRNQRLATSFVQEGIKIETDCAWYKPWKGDGDCAIIAIEATATAPTNGGTTMNRKTAFIHAGNDARANVAHFIKEDITSTRVTKTIAKNVEKALDKLNTRSGDSDMVELTDKEVNESAATVKADNGAKQDTNLRENSNNTARYLTTTVRANSTAVLKGFKTIKQEVVGPQEVAVTIRWDKNSEAASKFLESKFGGR